MQSITGREIELQQSPSKYYMQVIAALDSEYLPLCLIFSWAEPIEQSGKVM